MEVTSRVSRWEVWLARPLVHRIALLDERLLLGLAMRRTPLAVACMRTLTHLADLRGLAVLALVVCAVVGNVPSWMPVALAGGLLSTLLVNVLKRWLCRPRPDVAIEGFSAVLGNPDAFAFPSGHTAAAFSAATALAAFHPVFAPGVLLLASAVGLSRAYLGAHYPLDVAAGALLGSASTVLVLCL